MKGMPTVFARLLLFLSSYFPLAVVFFFLFFECHFWIGLGILGVGLIGTVGLFVFLRTVRKLAPFTIRVDQIQRRDGEAMSYIATYVIPFLAVPFSAWQQAAALATFFLVLAVLYVHSNMIHINPMLNLTGYHLYEVTQDNGAVFTLITRRRLRRADSFSVVSLDNDIILEKD